MTSGDGSSGGGQETTEQDLLISRLVARIAELEDKLYSKDLATPAVPEASTVPAATQEKPNGDLSITTSSLLSALKNGIQWTTMERSAAQAASPAQGGSDWFFSVAPKQPPSSSAAAPQGSMLSIFGSPEPQRQQPDGEASSDASSVHSGMDYGVRPDPEQHGHGDAAAAADGSGRGRHVEAEAAGSLSGELQLLPTPELTNKLVIDGPIAPTRAGASSSPGSSRGPSSSGAPGPSPSRRAAAPTSLASDWLANLFSARRGPDAGSGERAAAAAAAGPAQGEAFSEAAFRRQMEERGRAIEADATRRSSGSYISRYVFPVDPVDLQAEMEVTHTVRRAAGEALMEVQEKLRAAEEAQESLRQQLESQQQLQQEVERLLAENQQALEARKRLEDELISAAQKLEDMAAASSSLQEELESLHTQSQIWKSDTGEQEKLKQENALLRSQLQTRLNDLQVTKVKLSEAEAEKQRQARDLDDLNAKLQWLNRINAQLESSAEQLEHFRKASAEFQERFIRERNVRRKLHEQLQVLKGNIRVMCRVRPPLPEQPSIVSFPLEGLLAIAPPDRRPQEFEFDHVFPPEATQEAVYAEVSALVRSCADGHNVCIFAFGQTGSGKTFTMEGPAKDRGIYVRALQDLFSFASEEGSLSSWRIEVAMMEIYNEHVQDLLLAPAPSDASGGAAGRSLEVSGLGTGEMPEGVERVPGLSWRQVSTSDQVQQVLKEGSRNRATAATALNAHSSRSHALLSVRVTLPAGEGRCTTSTIHLVDLAGSERVDKSEAAGQTLKEAQSINKSLSALGDVIAALKRRSPHIPFRNSKLTQVLQDALSGSSKVLLVCNVSPEPNSAMETLSTLNFASRAAQVELGPQAATASGRKADGQARRSDARGGASPGPQEPAASAQLSSALPGAAGGNGGSAPSADKKQGGRPKSGSNNNHRT